MIIGVLGKKRSGKDTVGDYLIKNQGFIKINMADALKHGVMDIFGFSHEQVFGDLKDVVDDYWNVTPREVLQIMGSEVFQFDMPKYINGLADVGRSFWVKRIMKDISNNRGKNIVICDIRFEHEIRMMKSIGGSLLKIERPSLNSSDSHISENELDGIDFGAITIVNDSDLDSLYGKVEHALIRIAEKPF